MYKNSQVEETQCNYATVDVLSIHCLPKCGATGVWASLQRASAMMKKVRLRSHMYLRACVRACYRSHPGINDIQKL